MERRRGLAVVAGTLAALLVACSSGEPSRSNGDAGGTGLAPSQISGSTVAAPDTPPRCDPVDLSWWTAQVVTYGESPTATVRVRNDSGQRCEVDVAESEGASAEMEPSVWLERGEWADLLAVSSPASSCAPSVVDHVDVRANGVDVSVPTLMVGCRVALLAFYVADPPGGPCTRLASAVADDELLLRNDTLESCGLGSLDAGDGVDTGVAADGTPIEIIELAAGDIVAFDLRTPDGEACEDVATLTFSEAGDVEVPGLGGCGSVVLGPGRPWFDGSVGPRRDLGSDDVAAALEALAPFG